MAFSSHLQHSIFYFFSFCIDSSTCPPALQEIFYLSETTILVRWVDSWEYFTFCIFSPRFLHQLALGLVLLPGFGYKKNIEVFFASQIVTVLQYETNSSFCPREISESMHKHQQETWYNVLWFADAKHFQEALQRKK